MPGIAEQIQWHRERSFRDAEDLTQRCRWRGLHVHGVLLERHLSWLPRAGLVMVVSPTTPELADARDGYTYTSAAASLRAVFPQPEGARPRFELSLQVDGAPLRLVPLYSHIKGSYSNRPSHLASALYGLGWVVPPSPLLQDFMTRMAAAPAATPFVDEGRLREAVQRLWTALVAPRPRGEQRFRSHISPQDAAVLLRHRALQQLDAAPTPAEYHSYLSGLEQADPAAEPMRAFLELVVNGLSPYGHGHRGDELRQSLRAIDPQLRTEASRRWIKHDPKAERELWRWLCDAVAEQAGIEPAESAKEAAAGAVATSAEDEDEFLM